ncbi:MAG: CoA transferase [Alphaproteobacteria bacterium]|nr:CoA transferase [Alphaproteobacteria bacterium]
MSGPLEGLRIIDATSIVSGPFATTILGDQGADIIKIEQPGLGDLIRYMGLIRNNMSAVFAVLNRNKRSIAVNVAKPEGKELIYDLVRKGDAFVQNYRPGVAERMGIGYEQLKKINPDIVYVSISGFGDSGPYANKRVYDPIVQAIAGYTDVQGDPKTGKPEIVRTIVIDKVTSLTACQAITAGLLAKARGKGGQHIKLSMLDASLQFLWSDALANYIYVGEEKEGRPNLSDLYRVFATQDGYITSIVSSDSEWQGFCRAMKRPELSDDERYATIAARGKNAFELWDIVEAEYLKYGSTELMALLDGEDVPCGVVNRRDSLHLDPQIVQQKSLLEIKHPTADVTMRSPRPATQFGDAPWEVERHAPMLGEHTDEVLREVLGKDDAAINSLREKGAIG